ncbi:ECF transporter S component [Niallia sp. NCCP-28]|uniref:ECF transporter S component n=1 Tax=Niallia sp. NCCP-28 TaxID=2934712 RepID=UPI00208AECCE|nr:ECF transporter S component [Niallia sp. NCCP-28]GKU81042.1 riboflavin transporter FmnP [Niallia sp. NCCP-28]
MKKKMNVRTYVGVGMLSSLAYILMFMNFPIPPFPTFLKIDFSDIPALIAAFIFGPLAGVLVELIKNIIDYFITGSETGIPVGHMANFIAGVSFILPTYYIYNKLKSKKGMVFGLVVSVVLMSTLLSFFNYFVLLPVFMKLMNTPMSGPEIRQYVVSLILPFNLLKGFIISVLFMLVFSKMRGWIMKQQAQYNSVMLLRKKEAGRF